MTVVTGDIRPYVGAIVGTAYVVEVSPVGDNGRPVTVHTPDGRTIFATIPVEVDPVTGVWSQDLEPCDGAALPAGFRWRRIIRSVRDQVVMSNEILNVPTSATPVPEGGILDEVPGAVETAALTDHKLDLTAHGNPLAALASHEVDLDAHGQAFISRPRGWGERWSAALADAGTRLVRAAAFGESVTCGLIADDHDLGWWGRTRTVLQTDHGDGGSGWLDWFNSAVGGFGGPGGPTGGDTTSTGSWTDVGGGVNGNARRPTVAGNGATLTFHPRGTVVEIVTRTDPSFGRYDYQIDGGDVVQVPQNLAAAVSTVTVSGLAPSAHTVVITAAAGQCRIHGVRGRNATGIMLDNLSIGGRSIVSQNLGLNVAAEGLAGETTLSTTFDVARPLDLVVIALGVNDAVSVANPNYDTMWSTLNDLQREIRAAGVDATTPPEVVVVIEHISGFADTSEPYKYPRIAAVLREWAATTGAAVVDVWAAGRHSGEYAAGLGWFVFGASDVHLAAPGSIAYSALVRALIDPEGLA